MNNLSHRRKTAEVSVGNVKIGSDQPVRVQSMTTTATLDTEASVRQAAAIALAGGELVRLTAQGVNHAKNLANIHSCLRQAGIDVPLVADIHFNPAAAFEAALHVEKVRINPGNFCDPGRTFVKMDFTDSEYQAELERIRQKFVPFLNLCKQNGTAIRIGVNHGSLSDRIMSRYGADAEGMVESAMEFLRICKSVEFNNVVVSIKASSVPVMADTVRLLAQTMEREGLNYPLHLGVTEAGNELEGRIKSAVGIGSLLADGIGDTIRVSLSEAPEAEIPVAQKIIAHIAEAETHEICHDRSRRKVRGTEMPKPSDPDGEIIVVGGGNRIARARRILSQKEDGAKTLVLEYPEINDKEELIVSAAIDFGTLLLDGFRMKMRISSPILSEDENTEIVNTIIQAAGIMRFKADIVACPGCGRTLFDLPTALAAVKNACGHLKQLKIAVMGCIVNGPGEMADADYGYVGGAAGSVSLYRGKECVEKNLPQEKAASRLVELIKSDGKWEEPNE